MRTVQDVLLGLPSSAKLYATEWTYMMNIYQVLIQMKIMLKYFSTNVTKMLHLCVPRWVADLTPE